MYVLGLSSLEKLVSLAPLAGGSAAMLMVRAAPALVQRCMSTSKIGTPLPALARKLFTYLLVHPALINNHHHQR